MKLFFFICTEWISYRCIVDLSGNKMMKIGIFVLEMVRFETEIGIEKNKELYK